LRLLWNRRSLRDIAHAPGCIARREIGMKVAFVDAEFTGEHARATLVSIGIVGMGDETLSISFSDYDRDQVTPWLRENVLCHIDESRSMSQCEAFPIVARWFEEYSAGERVSLVSTGKMLDLLLLFELWRFSHADRRRFHHLHSLPRCLNHSCHFDLETILFLAGVDPRCDREQFIGHSVQGRRHNALYDAMVVRECFKRCMTHENFPAMRVEGTITGGMKADWPDVKSPHV
jgi:DNA polymerase III epsilon subunit-like protein